MKLLRNNRNFTLVFFGALVSSAGDVLFSFAMGLYILDVTHSAVMLSLYGIIGGVTWIVLAPFGGVMVDRMSRVKIIYMTDFVRGVNILFCGGVMLLTDDPMIIMVCLCLSSIISSINGALFGPASQAIIPMTVEEESLVQANSLMSLMYGTKDVFGMLLAGVLYSLLGPIIVVFINGISFIISGFTEMFIKVEEGDETHPKVRSNVLVEMKEGFHYIVSKNAAIMMLLVIVNFKNLSLGPIQSVLVPYLINEHIQANQMHLSYLYTAMALGGILGSLGVANGWLKGTTYQVLKYSLFMLLGTLFIQWGGFEWFNFGTLPYLGFFSILVTAFIISGIINVLVQVPIMSSLQKVVEPQYHGRVMSLFTMISSISAPISLMIGGIVIDQFGIGITYLISIGFLILGMIGMFMSKTLKKIL